MTKKTTTASTPTTDNAVTPARTKATTAVVSTQPATQTATRRAAARDPKQAERATDRQFRWIVGTVTIIVLLVVWQVVVSSGNLSPRVISSPSMIVEAFEEDWSQILAPATAITAMEGVVGFIAAVPIGILFGVMLSVSRLFSAALYPLLAIAQMLPLITVAPLFIIWFGFEPFGKIVMVAVFSVFPIAVQTYRGLQAVPSYYTDVALTCGAGRVYTLFHVKLRVAVGQIFGGMKIAAVYVFATAATAEYLGARNGLGIVLQSAFNSFETPLIFAATTLIVVMTGLLWWLLSAIEKIWFPDDAVELSVDGR
ncbi:MAG: ABC transporter permease [Aeriscardovia sp.]|nr:ABC transporter permease [Aeriscardovia sp.]